MGVGQSPLLLQVGGGGGAVYEDLPELSTESETPEQRPRQIQVAPQKTHCGHAFNPKQAHYK